MMRMKPSNRGVAMLIALIAALLVSLTAIITMNLVGRRFHLSAFGTDHAKAFSASEAGVKYALTRLWREANFQSTGVSFEQTVRGHLGNSNNADSDGIVRYVIGPQGPGSTVQPNNYPTSFTVDEQDSTLGWGMSKGVLLVVIEATNPAAPQTSPLKIRAFSDYGTAQAGFGP